MSPQLVTTTALDRATYAEAMPAGDPFYVEPPSVPAGLTIDDYRRRRSGSKSSTRRRLSIWR